MSEEVKEIVLVGGSKDGTIAENDSNTKAINNIVLNEAGDAPEYIDLYLPTNVTDKENRPIYAHIGRYDAEESASYWATLSEDEKKALKDAHEAAKEFVEEKEKEDETETTTVATEESGNTSEEGTSEDAAAESTSSDDANEEAGKETTSETDGTEGDGERTDDVGVTSDEVTEVEEDAKETE